MRMHPIRLSPNQDIYEEIVNFTRNVNAGAILTCVGSLSQATIRFAGQKNNKTITGTFEIISLTGTLSADGVHLHISIANECGTVIGGHLASGNRIRTTAEIIIVTFKDYQFSRAFDPQSGYRELKIIAKQC